jgi:rfaE bifunctional protein kinase chain/domain
MNESAGIVPDLEKILQAIPSLRIGVVGDFCLDFYQFVDLSASEISVETGLATLPVREVRYTLGGAGNVVDNLCTLGARGVRCYGVVGRDPHGQLLVGLLRDAGADPSGILTHSGEWLTQTYTKVIVGEQENPRIDWGNYNRLSPDTEAELAARIRHEVAGLDLLIINQQLLHGIHSPGLRKTLSRITSSGSPLCITDSRDYSEEYSGSIRKLNDHEGSRLCGREEAREIAELLFDRWKAPVLLTRGEHGCLVRDASGLYEVPGLLIPSRIDTVGAGDSMLAGTAAALGAGKELRHAAMMGNLVAAITVQKLHRTGTATPEEVRAYARTAAYRFRPEVAARPDRAHFHPNTQIEIVTAPPATRNFSHAIFDNDGTLSTLRQGWEEVMEPMMVRSILGEAAGTVDERTYHTVLDRVREFIDRTTGIQTIVQMEGLGRMVRDFGFVPKDKLLTAEGYKEIYNQALMVRVDERIRRLESGELEPSDFIVKRSVEFVSRLVEHDIVVYLASGTDHADVRREAGALGYARLFAGHIYGAVGDIHNDPKKKVIEKILAQIGSGTGSSILTFGDGPVEIRETQRRGGYTVGVASNEPRRFGLNPAKRKRLVEAGADLIIPDFSQFRQLIPLLFGEH